MNLFFCGDIMPGGVLPYQREYISSELQNYMQGFDFRIGTLEAAVGTNLPYDEIKMKGRQNIVFARDEDFFRVKEMGFDVVSLANNHIWDLGEEGLKNTIRLLEENNIKYCGAGLNIEEASKPAIIEKDGLRVAILAYCMYGNPWMGYVELAGTNKAGVNPLDIEKVVCDIRETKKKYDRVIVMPHWGKEYQYEPLTKCITMAKRMVEAGADAILGSHPHHIQPLLKIRNVPVCFSMGNFLFPDFYMFPPRPIWYPSKYEDLSQIKRVESYPFPISEPILQVWNKEARVGQIISFQLSKEETNCNNKFLNLSKENIVSFVELDSRMKRSLWVSRKQIKSNNFSVALQIVRKFKHRFIDQRVK